MGAGKLAEERQRRLGHRVRTRVLPALCTASPALSSRLSLSSGVEGAGDPTDDGRRGREAELG